MRTLILGLSLLAACNGHHHGDDSGNGGDDTGAADMNHTRQATTDGGTFDVSYVPSPDPIPMSEEFGLVVSVARADDATPVESADVVVDATMPGHGHGMNTTASTVSDQGGDYTIEGMLFHMEGHWRVTVDVTADSVTERAVFDVECCE